MDPSNPCDTQNFEKAFLDMKPVISDDTDEDKVQEQEQIDIDSSQSEDLIVIPSPRVSHLPEGTVGDYEGHTPTNQPSIVTNRVGRGHGVDKEVETSPKMLEGSSTIQTILKIRPVDFWKSSPRTQRTLGSSEREPHQSTRILKLASFTNAALLVIPDNPTQGLEKFTLPTDAVANAAKPVFARHNLDPKPKPNRHQSNVKRTRQKEIDAPKPDHCLSDTEDDSVDDVHGEKLDNCPRNLSNCDGESTNGPRSIKTVSCWWLGILTPRQQD